MVQRGRKLLEVPVFLTSVYMVQISEFTYTFDNISMVDHVNRLSICFFLSFLNKFDVFLPCPDLAL